jgi:hypothetical protein
LDEVRSPAPTALIAETAKSYWSPLVSPDKVHVVAPVVAHVWPPRLAAVESFATTEYPRIALPPVDVGALQVTTDWVLAFEVALTVRGAPGATSKDHVSDRPVVPS